MGGSGIRRGEQSDLGQRYAAWARQSVARTEGTPIPPAPARLCESPTTPRAATSLPLRHIAGRTGPSPAREAATSRLPSAINPSAIKWAAQEASQTTPAPTPSPGERYYSGADCIEREGPRSISTREAAIHATEERLAHRASSHSCRCPGRLSPASVARCWRASGTDSPSSRDPSEQL